jgi:hypothetical protein
MYILHSLLPSYFTTFTINKVFPPSKPVDYPMTRRPDATNSASRVKAKRDPLSRTVHAEGKKDIGVLNVASEEDIRTSSTSACARTNKKINKRENEKKYVEIKILSL